MCCIVFVQWKPSFFQILKGFFKMCWHMQVQLTLFRCCMCVYGLLLYRIGKTLQCPVKGNRNTVERFLKFIPMLTYDTKSIAVILDLYNFEWRISNLILANKISFESFLLVSGKLELKKIEISECFIWCWHISNILVETYIGKMEKNETMSLMSDAVNY